MSLWHGKYSLLDLENQTKIPAVVVNGIETLTTGTAWPYIDQAMYLDIKGAGDCTIRYICCVYNCIFKCQQPTYATAGFANATKAIGPGIKSTTSGVN